MSPTPLALRKTLPAFSQRLRLGRSGLSVSPICVGMVRSPDAICAAFDAGVNFFFFSADMHWPLYEATRRGLAKLLRRGPQIREQIVVAVVSYPTQLEFCTMPFLEAVEAVPGLLSIDVLVVGGAYSAEYLPRLAVYEEHRARRFLGATALGTTFHERRAAAFAMAHELVDIAFVRFNPAHPGAQDDLFPALRAERRSLLYSFKSASTAVTPERCRALGVGNDHWYPKATDYYRFALSHPQLDGLLCSPATRSEVGALDAALAEGGLDVEEVEYLIDLSDLDAGRASLQTGGPELQQARSDS